MAQACPLIDIKEIQGLTTDEQKKQDKKNPTEPWKEIIIDPDQKLPEHYKREFVKINKKFQTVFGSDLPRYNGRFGRVEAVINMPSSLPA